MSLVSGQLGIPMVGIEPSAAPITTNVQPAPGQPLRGNTLQQVAEALSAFNAGLVGLGQAVVNRDNQAAADAGAAADLVRQEDLLKKSWRQIIADTNSPHAANPYYQVEAAKNLGRRLAIDSWRRVRERKDQITDPVSPADLASVYEESVDADTRRLLAENYYARLGFDESSQRLRVEAENAFDQERLRRIEARAGIEFERMASGMLVDAASGRIGAEEMEAQLSTAWSALNSVTSDPTDLERILLKTIDSALKALPSDRAVDDAVSMIGRLSFQGATVESNIPLMARLHESAVEASRLIAARSDADDREMKRKADEAERRALEGGAVTRLTDAVRDGRNSLDAVDAEVRRFAEQNPDVPTAVLEGLKLRLQAVTRGIEGLGGSGRDDPATVVDFMVRVASGEFEDQATLVAAARAGNLRDLSTYKDLLQRWADTQEGGAVALAMSGAADDLFTYAMRSSAEMGAAMTSGEAQAFAFDSERRMNEHLGRIQSGAITDDRGRTVDEIRASEGSQAAKAFVAREVGKYTLQLKQELNDSLKAKMEAENAAGVVSAPVAAGATRDSRMSVVRVLDPTTKSEGIDELIDQAVQLTSPIQDAFGFRMFGSREYFLLPSSLGGYADTVTPHEYRVLSSRMLQMERGSSMNVSLESRGFEITVSRDDAGDMFTVTRRFSSGPSGTRIIGASKGLSLTAVRNAHASLLGTPLAALGLQNVLDGTTGDPALPIERFVDQNGTFPWSSVRIFADREEFARYRDDPEVRQMVHERMRISGDASIRGFVEAQNNLLRVVEEFEAQMRRKR